MRVSLAMAVALSLASVALADPAQASIKRETTINPQNLASALRSFAAERGIAMVYRADLVSNKDTSGASGDLTLDEALTELLSGTHLTYKFLDDKTVTIVPIALMAPSNSAGSGVAGTEETSQSEAGDLRKGPAGRLRLAQADESAPASQAEAVQEITVTGSRIAQTTGFSTPTPVTATTTERLQEMAPTSITDALKQLPQFQGLTTGATSPSASGTKSVGNFLNLRGIGANRTLVMLDGNRVASGTPTGGVDAGTFPQLLLQRVDVVTGGASAAYGSDAVSGVANFIVDKKFEGVKGVVAGGMSGRGDDQNYRFQLAAGGKFVDGRLHLEVSAEDSRDGGIPNGANYPYMGPRVNSLQDYQNQSLDAWGGKYGVSGPNGALPGTAGNPFVVYHGARYSSINVLGEAKSGPFSGDSIVNGQLVPQTETLISGTSCIDCPNNMGLVSNRNTLIPSLRNSVLFGRADYEISDNLSVWTEVGYDNSAVFNDSLDTYNFSNITIFSDNAYLPQAARDQLTATNTQSFKWTQTLTKPFFPTATGYQATRAAALNVIAGLDGKAGDTGRWNVTATDSRYNRQVTDSNDMTYAREAAAIDAVTDPATGKVVCRVTLTNPTLYPGCLPLNVFGYNVADPAAAQWIGSTAYVQNFTELKEIQTNASGTLFSMWAGDVKGALGAGYREESLDLTTNQNPGTYPSASSPQGIRGLSSNSKFIGPNTPNASATNKVKEAFAEGFVPLVKEVPFINSLSLDGALRFTKYTYGGSVVTWKGSIDWSVNEQVRLRGTVSRDIRAPSLGELFGGQSRGPLDATDTHSGGVIHENVINITGSNPALTPEKSTAYTGGIVLQPEWLSGFSLSVDYWDFNIKNAINAPYTLQQIVTLCEQSGGTGATCPLITRVGPFSDHSATNVVLTVTSTLQNSASTKVNGVDTEAGYRHPLFGGNIDARLLMSYLDQYVNTNAPGQPQFVYSGDADGFGGLPHWKGSSQLKYSQGPFAVEAQERMIGPLDISRLYVTEGPGSHMPAVFYTDLNATYDLEIGKSNVQFYANVANLFNKWPPYTVASLITGGPPLQYSAMPIYDWTGTNFNVGFRFHF